VTTRATSAIPSKISAALPPWNNRSFVTTNALHWSQLAPLPDRRCGRLITAVCGDATLYGWYIPFAGEPLLSGSGWRSHSIPPRALGTPSPAPPFAVSASLRLFGQPSRQSFQIQDIHPFFTSIKLTVTTRHAAAVLSLSGGSSSAAFFPTSSSPSNRQ
jgi:hypothetical protein